MTDDDVQDLGDDHAPLIHRTDRIALRNESQTPVVFVDDDPLYDVEGEAIRHQHYEMEVTTLDETETAIREIIDRFEAPTERQFYYAVCSDRAQICGNTLDDFFDAMENFRVTYADLDEQLPDPTDRVMQNRQQIPLEVTAVGVTEVSGIWLQFVTHFLAERETEQRHHSATTLFLTTHTRQGPLIAQWLRDRLEHPSVGSPSAVSRQHHSQLSLSLKDPLTGVKAHRLVGYQQELEPSSSANGDAGIEYISCHNPYYNAEGAKRSELNQQITDTIAPDELRSVLLSIDRIPLRPRGGSLGLNVDQFVDGRSQFTYFNSGSGIALASGEVDPVKRK